MSSTISTPDRILATYTTEAAALKALAAYRASFEESGAVYAAEVGHSGPRLVDAAPRRSEVARVVDDLGSGEFYAVVSSDDGAAFALVGSW
jgi:hypothetical protein